MTFWSPVPPETIKIRVFNGRLNSGGILNNRLLFFRLFSGNFCGWGDKAVMERNKVVIGGFPQSLPLGKTLK